MVSIKYARHVLFSPPIYQYYSIAFEKLLFLNLTAIPVIGYNTNRHQSNNNTHSSDHHWLHNGTLHQSRYRPPIIKSRQRPRNFVCLSVLHRQITSIATIGGYKSSCSAIIFDKTPPFWTRLVASFRVFVGDITTARKLLTMLRAAATPAPIRAEKVRVKRAVPLFNNWTDSWNFDDDIVKFYATLEFNIADQYKSSGKYWRMIVYQNDTTKSLIRA